MITGRPSTRSSTGINKEYMDFSMGKGSSLTDQNMPDTMLKDVKNMYWDGGLKKRHGYKEVYDHTSGTINGHHFAYMNDYGVVLLAVLTTTTTKFYSNYSGTMTEIDASYTWSGASVVVRFGTLNGKTVIVDTSGTNKPGVIYYDSGVKIATLDSYDSRDIDTAFWYAGQFDDGASNEYIDDTTDAQSSTADDFILATATNNDGFYIASAQRFSKVTFENCDQFDGSPVAEYQYYNGTALTTLTLVTTPGWTDTAGDRTMEYDLPTDWDTWDGDDPVDSDGNTVVGGMRGMYVVRVRFTTAPDSEQVCDYLSLDMTRAVTFALSGEIPTDVCVHNSRVWLVSGNAANYSAYGQVIGWESYYYEYFSDGGPQINRLVSVDEYLIAVKDTVIMGLTGTTEENYTVKTLALKGTEDGNSCAVVKGVLFFVSNKMIWVFINGYVIQISKHISNIVEANGTGIEYNGYYYYISASRILLIDPDTISKDEIGDGIGAFWEFSVNAATSKYPVVYGDSTKFGVTSIQNRLVVAQGYKLHCLDYGTQYFDGTETAISCIVETKSYALKRSMLDKAIRRVKVLVNGAGNWAFVLYTQWKVNSLSVTIASGTTLSYVEEDISVPYTMDSPSYSFKLTNETLYNCIVYGFSVDAVARRF